MRGSYENSILNPLSPALPMNLKLTMGFVRAPYYVSRRVFVVNVVRFGRMFAHNGRDPFQQIEYL